jgi:hypothetical protein
VPLLIISLLAVTCTATGAWHQVDSQLEREQVQTLAWLRCVEITVGGTQSNEMLFGFPVMVRIPAGTIDPDLINAEGDNVAFFDVTWSQSATPLPHTFSVWNPDGESIAWVTLPRVLPGTDPTTIYLNYGGTERVADAESRYHDSSPFSNHNGAAVDRRGYRSRAQFRRVRRCGTHPQFAVAREYTAVYDLDDGTFSRLLGGGSRFFQGGLQPSDGAECGSSEIQVRTAV